MAGWLWGCLAPLSAQTYYWENLAGLGGGLGHVDGPVASAKILYPKSVVSDSLGNIYFLEQQTRTIRKLSTDGIVSTLAGNNQINGPKDGTGTAASFFYPGALVIDSSDNLFVADSSTIRKISPSGEVTTFAGKHGGYENRDGTGTNARFSGAEFLVIDPSGNLYTAGSFDYCVRKITPAAVVTTLAGKQGAYGYVDGKGAAARFFSIDTLFVDHVGNVYVKEFSHLRKVAPDGTVTTVPNSDVPLSPFDLDLMIFDAAGNMYCAAEGSGRIQKRTPDGVTSTFVGSTSGGYLDGPALLARFSGISSFFMDSHRVVTVIDSGAIRRVSAEPQVTTLFRQPGNYGKTDGTGTQARFINPSEILCTPQGNLITTERSNGDLRQTTPEGVVTTLVGGWALGETSTYSFTFADDLKTDSLGNLFVIESAFSDNKMRKIGPDGTTLLEVSSTSDGRGFNNPSAVALDNHGNIFVADSWNYRICKITPNRTCTTFAGSYDKYGYTDGVGLSARFGFIDAMVSDSQDNLYVADSSDVIRKITPQGRVSTFVGKAYEDGHVDGPKSTARIHTPFRMAVDAEDHLYILDRGASTVRKVSPDGSVRTIGGSPGVYSCKDGPGPQAEFCMPEGIAVSAEGTVYLTDSLNHRIVRGRVIRAELQVTGNGSPVAGGAAKPALTNHTDFGGAKAAAGSVSRVFELHSLGQETLSLTGTPKILIRGKHAADFTVTAEPVVNIAAGESSTLSITFAPSAKGLREAEVVIESTDAQEHAFTFAIQGTGDVTLPAITLVKPAAGMLSGLSPITVSGTVSDDTAVDRVEVSLDGGEPVMADLSSAAPAKPKAFQALLSPAEGQHSLLVTAFDTSGNSRSVTRAFSFVRYWQLRLNRQVPPALATKPDLAGSLTLKVDAKRSTPPGKDEPQAASLQPGTEVLVTATARAGFLFDHWSGLPEGTQVSGNVIRWIMPAADVNGVTATFIANPLLAAASGTPFPGTGSTVTFSGLVEPVESTPWSNAHVGHLSAVMTRSSGSMTGSFRIDGGSYPLNAQFLGDGSVWFRSPTGALTSTRACGAHLLALAWSSQGIAISVSGEDEAISQGVAAPAIPTPSTLLDARGRAALYTVIFPAQPQTPELPAARYPQGTGYASGTLSIQGTWPLAIALADGTKVTANAFLVRDTVCPLFVQLTTPGSRELGGSFSGKLLFDPTQADSDVSATSMHWFRSAVTENSNAATHLYTDGWPQGLTLAATGARYDASLSVQQGIGLPQPDSSAGNVSLTFAEGGLAVPWSSPPFNIAGNSVLKNPALSTGLSLTFTPAQGLFKGRFPPTWSSPSKTLPEFQGVLIQKGTHRGGHGFFLSNRVEDRDPLSGKVHLRW